MKKQFKTNKSVEVDVKSLATDNRQFSAIANRLNEVDSDGDVFVSGAFDRQLAKRNRFPLLYQHDAKDIIGYAEVKADANELTMQAELFPNGHPRADEVSMLLKAGALADLSIGFFIEPDAYDKIKRSEDGGLIFNEVGLREISLVLVGSNRSSVVTEVKEMSREDLLDDSELETIKFVKSEDELETQEEPEEDVQETKTLTAEEDAKEREAIMAELLQN